MLQRQGAGGEAGLGLEREQGGHPAQVPPPDGGKRRAPVLHPARPARTRASQDETGTGVPSLRPWSVPTDRPSSGSLLPLVGAVAVLALLLGGAVLLNLRSPDAPEPAAGFALDVEDPWPLRGDAVLVRPAALTGLRADWAGAAPLFARQRGTAVELVLLQPQQRRWAVATRTGGAWTLQERRLPDRPVGVLAAVLRDGGGRRLLAVTDPDVDGMAVVRGTGYADGEDLTPLADGVGESTLTEQDAGLVVGTDDEQVVVQARLPQT